MTLTLIFALLLAGAGAAGVVWSIFQIGAAYASRNWPRALGIVISSSVRRESDSDDEDVYYAHVRYTYQVNGHTYTSERVRFGGIVLHSRRRPALTLQRRYPEGAPVNVYYDPEDPSRSVLEAGNAVRAWYALVLSGAFFAMATAMATLAN